uniref:Uncharacterized protein n=1 Tax=Lotharella oceanica TaxID=641309 RepID=A0A7S2U0H7_9EUKA|mmetsp:Transcript_365/g.683  ORF Transcript_365/g.683 Transcript_365/m.683 type:complete len:310 (+) Transcript_365:89-1018(+)|eukprot:CAMPEP_0170177608 /NCGR_PEP_ID=MMETSP0040_2-20121228/10589_1 /TAXON_ID=641309 /ORGANISM="Lotharella oceanica, Strain CCMP622" /LENGTH=309 /DNA_ID=CAMNT_0010420299 /DNA_START=90 /DNA_END=1019 /DNA_ORIENTATION=+
MDFSYNMNTAWDHSDPNTPTLEISREFSPRKSNNAQFDSLLLSPVEKLSKIMPEDDVWRSFVGGQSPNGNQHFSEADFTKPNTFDVEGLIVHGEEKETFVPNLERKRVKPEKKAMEEETTTNFYYKDRKYIGPTKANRPNYKAKQAWEWDVYPHGISKQNGKLRVQIKQKGVNPTYPSFPNTMQGLLDAAMFRDREAMRLLEAGILVRVPKFNFEHPEYAETIKSKSGRKRRRGRKTPSKTEAKTQMKTDKEERIFDKSATIQDLPMSADPFDVFSGDAFSMSAFAPASEFTTGTDSWTMDGIDGMMPL